METDIGVAHNGVLPITPRAGVSDTMEYIASQLSVMKRIDQNFPANPLFLRLVENAVGTNRLCFLTGDGEISTVGNWVEHEGMLYSNDSFRPKRYSTNNTYKTVIAASLLEIDGYIVTEDNRIVTGDFYYDCYGTVYRYDMNDDALVQISAEARDEKGNEPEWVPEKGYTMWARRNAEWAVRVK